MSVTSIVWFLALWTATHWLLSQLLWRIKRAPPGPLPLPLVGNIFNLGKKPHISLFNLAKSHGPLMSLRLGFLTTVVVSSPELARDVLQKKDTFFSNRFVGDCVRAHHHNENAISSLPVGDRWRTLRKILHVQLLSGRSLDASEDIRRRKIRDLVCYVDGCSRSGVAVDVGQLAFDTTFNFLSNAFFSFDMADLNSSLCREFKKTMWEVMFEAGRPNVADMFPVLKAIDPQRIRRRMETHFSKLFHLFDGIFNKRLADRDAGMIEGGDILDALLKICREKSEDLELSQIPPLLVEIFGGPETTSITVEWAMAELLRNPGKMRKAKIELEQVIGKGNFIEEGDIAKLPYLQAILKETFRLHPPLVFSVPRQADWDTEINGFVVPKDSQILINLWAIGRDPAIWNDPHSFEPERFLNSEIDIKGQHFELIPFGACRRICPGLALAMKMVHVMVASLMHFFEWKLEDVVEPESLDMDEKFGVGLHKAKSLYAIPMKV